MGSPIFDATFGTGRFMHEEATKSPERQDVREALADLVKWKDYKDEHGADATYELGKERAWRNARAALAQSDAGPVAWQWQEKATPEFGWAFCRNEEERFYMAQYPSKYNLRPLYTAPPRPDASGLIEALERISKSDVYDMDTLHPDRCASVAAEALKAFRAADRSAT